MHTWVPSPQFGGRFEQIGPPVHLGPTEKKQFPSLGPSGMWEPHGIFEDPLYRGQDMACRFAYAFRSRRNDWSILDAALSVVGEDLTTTHELGRCLKHCGATLSVGQIEQAVIENELQHIGLAIRCGPFGSFFFVETNDVHEPVKMGYVYNAGQGEGSWRFSFFPISDRPPWQRDHHLLIGRHPFP